MVDALFLQTFKVVLDEALNNLMQLKVSLLMAGGWIRQPIKLPSNPNSASWRQCTRNFKALLEYLFKSKVLSIEISNFCSTSKHWQSSLETHTVSIYFFLRLWTTKFVILLNFRSCLHISLRKNSLKRLSSLRRLAITGKRMGKNNLCRVYCLAWSRIWILF